MYTDNASHRDKKQSCYFAKVCECEFNKNHIGVNLFFCYFVYKNKCYNLCVKKAHNLFKDVGGYFLKIPGRYREDLKSRENSLFCNKIRISHVFSNFI